MPERPESRPTPLGVYDKPTRERMSPAEAIALILSVLWLFGAGLFFLLLQDPNVQSNASFDPLNFVMVLLAIFMPVALVWVAATAARSSRVVREESRRLHSAIEAIRTSYLAEVQKGMGRASDESIAKKLDEIADAQRKTETALATFHSTRAVEAAARVVQAEPEPAAAEGQADLPLELGPEANRPPLSRDVFVRALNFPETAEDEEGFAALRKALKDRQAANLIQAAQDVLTLLSQDGIYMDDLRPDQARPDVWRQFAHGVRGRAVASLGGVRDRSSLALTAARMKQDPIFRDAAHHFLRKFDHMFAEFEAEATDADIQGLGDTRTARAFMLLGRVAGTFD